MACGVTSKCRAISLADAPWRRIRTIRLSCWGVSVAITPRELALLEHLLRRAGQVVPKANLEDQLYAMDAEVTPNALEVAVSRLRKRLASAGADVILRTAHGVGYVLLASTHAACAHG